jgi:hypothetical protein
MYLESHALKNPTHMYIHTYTTHNAIKIYIDIDLYPHGSCSKEDVGWSFVSSNVRLSNFYESSKVHQADSS